MAKIHKQHSFEVYSSRPQSDDITHAHPTTHQLADKLYNEHSMPVSRVAVHSVNGGHKLVHNTSAQKKKLIFRVFFLVKCTDCFILQSGGAVVETISLVARKLSGSAAADIHNFGRIFSKH